MSTPQPATNNSTDNSASAARPRTFLERIAPAIAHGIPVIPIPAGLKKPILKRWPDLATTDRAQLEQWSIAHGDSNYGCVANKEASDGKCMLDPDSPGLIERIESETGQKIPRTFTVLSANKRAPHTYFLHTERSRALGNRKGKEEGLKFDFQAHRTQVVGPGSVLANGAEYTLSDDIPLVPIPDWLCDWIERNSESEKPSGTGKGVPTRPEFDIEDFLEYFGLSADLEGDWYITDVCPVAGYKHEQSTRTGFYFDGEFFGFHCFATGCPGSSMTIGQVVKHLNKVARQNGKQPYPKLIWPDESEQKEIDGAFPHTQTGNAERFVSEHGNDFRYVHDLKQWYQWDGKRWARDAEGEVHRRFKETAQNMLKAAAEIKDDRQRQENAKWALKCQSEHTRRASVALAAVEKSVSALRGQFDQNKYLLNVANGTLDLRTFTLRPHGREDMLTKIIPVPYNPEAKCPRWLQFLGEIFPDQPDTIDFLQRSLGYTLTGSIEEQCFWLLIGVGKNGKSVFLSTMHHVMGDYAASTSFNTFTVQNGRVSAINPRDGLASLEGARFVRASESDEGKQVSESLLKALTGGEQVRTARMYADDYVYDPTFKIWLSTNHEPTIKGTDEAIWRRIHRVNFDVVVSEDKRDFQLTDKLIAEAEGILAWVVEGLKKYQKDGLRVPERVKKATQEYRSSQDIVEQFFAECTVKDHNGAVESKVLYAAFKSWVESNGERAMPGNKFGEEAKKHCEPDRKGKARARIYRGRKLVDDTAPARNSPVSGSAGQCEPIQDEDLPF